MPAAAPPLTDPLAKALTSIGARIRRQRRALKINAIAAAEAASMSRVTWHRIERGEPSVTMGAYLSAAAAVGLALDVFDPAERRHRDRAAGAALPETIRLADYPQLRRIAWQMADDTELTPAAALELYERNWRQLFEREHHRRIALLLQALDADLLAAHGCWFGGGTAIVLRHGEYRESVHIAFMVSNLDGYRALRQRLVANGVRAIARQPAALTQARELRADQYGVRTSLRAGDIDIKFEIVLEARIDFESPSADDAVCGVKTLGPLDLAASKLLANSDRWADDSVFSRDLIDLAMMSPPRPLLKRAIAKAAGAYGTSIEADLATAIDRLRQRPGRLDACRSALRMDAVPPALLWQRIRALKPRSHASRA